MSKIIFLNGCGSSGKTSIARALQHGPAFAQELWLTFGIDTFIDMISPKRQEAYFTLTESHNERGPLIHVASTPKGETLFGLMPKFAKLLADAGHNLIIDEVQWDTQRLHDYGRHLAGHTVYYIGVMCDLAVMQTRERVRQDRDLGLANAQWDCIPKQGYDFLVDTTEISPARAARLIAQFIQNTPLPKGIPDKAPHLNKTSSPQNLTS